jgi:hypothetical protein
LANELLDDRALLVTVARDIVHKALARGKAKPTLKAAETARRQRVARQAASKAEARVVAGKVKEALLLDAVVPLLTGEQRALRFVYGREIDQLGAAYQRIAERSARMS